MLERRGVAGCILAFFVTSLIALAASSRGGAGALNGAASPEVLAGAVAIVIAAAAAWLISSRSTHGMRSPVPHPTPTLVVLEGSSHIAEERAPNIDDMIHMLDDAVVLSREIPVVQRLQAIELTGLLSASIAEHDTGSDPGRLMLAGKPPQILALADRSALSRVFGILISNALSGGSRATFRIDHGTTALVVHVDDNGLGLPRAERETVFQRAYHMEILPSQRSNHCAELVIARQIARAHGGDIVVSSSPEGGARFTLRLPKLLEQENALQVAS
jgi:two-component system osmolarity sensor histidine kinase EnvZ